MTDTLHLGVRCRQVGGQTDDGHFALGSMMETGDDGHLILGSML